VPQLSILRRIASERRLFVTLVAAMVVAEFGILRFIDSRSALPWTIHAFLDAALLVLLVFPLVTIVFLRPLKTHSVDLARTNTLLQAREAELRASLEATVDGLLVVDEQGKIVQANRRFVELWGIPESLLARGDDRALLQFVLDQLLDPAAFLAKVEALYATSAEDEDELHFKDGRVFERYSLPMIADGERIGRVWSFRDVSERRRADVERDVMREIAQSIASSSDLSGLLRLMHQSLRRVLSAENCFVALYDRDSGRFSFPYFADERGEAPTQPVAIPLSGTAYVYRTDRPALITPSVFRDLVARGEVELTGPFSPAWMGVPVRTPAGVIGVLVVQHYEREDAYSERDLVFLAAVGNQAGLVIERRLAVERLRESERRLREAEELAELGSWEMDMRTRQVIVSEGLCRMMGRDPTRTNLTLDELAAYFPADDWRQLEAGFRTTAVDGSRFEMVLQVLREDGARRTQQGTCIAVRAPNGDIVRLRGTVFDITARREAEEAITAYEARLEQARRMESIGRLAGGIAHDLNNALTVILGNTEFALTSENSTSPLRENLTEVQTAARRSARLTRQLLAYAQRQTVVPAALDLDRVITSEQPALQRALGDAISLRWQPDGSLWPVRMDAAQFCAMLVNLCVNAREAGADAVTLLADNLTVDAARAASHPDATRGDFVRLRVRDNGAGMDATTLGRAFEPFFTTKGVGEGPGLGLAEVYGVVRQHGGFVYASSAVGQGTTVEVFLPRHAASPAAPPIA
jgi:PAS domain S-box-containing protein